MTLLSAAAAVGMAAFGAFIFYNTNVLNHYRTADDQLARQANYEKKYKALAADPQPKITAVKLAVDLYPREQQVRMRGTYTLVNKSGKPDRHGPPAVLPGRTRHGEQAGIRRARGACRRRHAHRPANLQACGAARPGRDHRTHVRPHHRRARLHQRGRVHRRRIQRVVRQRQPAAADHRLSAARRKSPPTASARNSACRRASARATATIPAGLAENDIAPDADFITFETTVGTEEDQIADRARLPAAGMDAGRPPVFQLQDGQPDPQFLRFPVGPLCGEEGPLERRRHRGVLPAGPRVQPRPDDRGHQVRARLLHGQFRTLPAQAVPDHRISALPGVRAVVRQHGPVFRGHRLHRPRARRTTRTTSTIRITSPRTSWPTSGGATRWRPATSRATRCWSRRSRSTRR